MPKDMVQVRKPGNNRFLEEPQIQVGRSQFDRSHMLKTAFDASYLYPILVDEVLPGDTFTCRLNGFCRITHPLDAPMIDNISVETFFFFVPNRLIWANWQYFMGEHDAAGAQDTDYTIPVLSGLGCTHEPGNYSGQALQAYMGVPHGVDPDDIDINALPFRAYNLIYNEWFRDQNLIAEQTTTTGNGPDNVATYYTLHKSAKKHDYFTSCLPYLQKGTAETITFSDTLYVRAPGDVGDYVSIYSDTQEDDQRLDTAAANVDISATDGDPLTEGLYVDMSGLTGITINDLRYSVAIQRLLERDARGGTRYVELIKSHFGVTSPDFRLQRPEFLGGGKDWINVNPVTASAYTATDPIGKVKGYGTGILQGHSWAKSFTEHGYVIGLIRARSDLTYFQGLDRMYSRSTRYDFYLPALAHLGEQPVYKKELFVTGDGATTDDTVFGYQERWAEYRYKPSRIAGILNPDTSGAYSYWHLAEDFASAPSLNQTFIEDQTPMDRVTTTDTGHQFLADIYFTYKCARPIPVHSIPSLMDRRF